MENNVLLDYLPFIVILLLSALILLALARFSKIDLDSALKIGGGVATVLSLIVGVIEFTAGQREQAATTARTEYIAATGQLTEPGSARPMAGIAALAQLAEHDTERTWLMTESLSAFIRSRAPRPEEDERVLRSSSDRVFAPYNEPPCEDSSVVDQVSSLEELYLYRNCNTVRSLSRTNLAVQTALTAIATRNGQNENKSNAPQRFRVQLESSNSNRLPEAKNSRYFTLGTIAQWHREFRRHVSLGSNRQLLQENHESVLTADPEILRRPWLNLAETELSGLDAAAGFLEGGNLSRSNLSFGALPGARLAMADLSESWLVGTDLFGADIRGASLEAADVRGADLGRANLSKAWMSGGSFHRANFWQTDLSKAYLIATDMSEVWTMSGARLDDVVAYRADFSRANLTGKEDSRVCMQRAFFEEAKFRCSVLNGVDLRNADLQDADLTNADLVGADLRGAKFEGAVLAGANLSNSDLRGTDLTGTTGKPSSIDGAVVDDRTKLPWPGNVQTRIRRSFLGIEWNWGDPAGCSTSRASNDEIGKMLEKTRVRSLREMRNNCPSLPKSYTRTPTQDSRQQPVGAGSVKLEILSMPTGADVELDSSFVGNTPASLTTLAGEHTVKVTKGGYFVWERKLKVSTGAVRIAPELEPLR